MKIFKYFILLLLFFSSKEFINAQQNNPPNWSWAKNVDGSSTNITTDSIGNSYVCGSHSASVTFGNTSLSGSGAYVVKYDSLGVFQSANQIATGTITPKDIVLDNAGNYYLSGSFSGTANFGGISLTSAGSTDVFTLKYNASGAIAWAIKSGGAFTDVSTSLSLDSDGNVLIVENLATSLSLVYAYVTKYNQSGTLQWTKQISSYSGSNNTGNAISTDQYGNSYVTGLFRNTSSNALEFCLVKFDPSGNVVWQRFGSGYANPIDLVADNSGNTYITGNYYNSISFGAFSLANAGLYDAFIVKYNAAGQVVWAKTAGGVDNDYGDGIALDASGNSFITGRFQQSALFGSFPIENLNSGVSDVFVAKYSSLGEILWVNNAGDGGVDAGNKIALDNASNCYVNGTFTTSISFGSSALTGGNDFSFISKIGANVQDTLSIFTSELESHTFVAGSPVVIDFTQFGTFSSDNIFTVELSDPVGGFFYPKAIGTGLTSPINAVIPPLTIPGSSYRIRVVASNPAIYGTDNGSDISVNGGAQQITPDWSWANNVASGNASISTDSIGNSYIFTNRTATIVINGTTLSGSGAQVVKYDSLGTIQQVNDVATGSLVSKDVYVDKSNNTYITGSFTGTANFGAFALTSAGSTDVFVAKYNASGAVVWAQKAGSSNGDIGNSITTDLSGNVFVSVNLSSTILNSQTANIIKYNDSGVQLWSYVVSAAGGNYNEANGISTDKFGNSYATGSYRNPSNLPQFFVQKLDPSGNSVWLKTGSQYAVATDIITDKNGSSYISGYFYSSATFGTSTISSSGTFDAFIVKYNAAGVVTWLKSAGGFDADFADGIALDKAGNSYLTGRFQQNAYFSGINISNFNSGVSDVFVAKYDINGNALWVKQAGETGIDAGSKIGVSYFGTSFITGTYTFDINFDNHILNGVANNSFVASIGSTYETSIGNAILIAGTNICAGNVFKVEYPVKGVFSSGNVFTAQLSDENGSFASPIDIGNITSEINNTIYAIIPDVTPGTGYRIRVVSSNIPLIGIDNGINLSINLANCDNVAPVLEIFPLVAFEYFFDTDNGVGTYVEIPVASSDSISLTHSISVTGLSIGFHNLFIRFKDSMNVWSLYEGRVIYVQPIITQVNEAPIVKAEYFFDTDPGVGNGLAIASFVKADSINLVKQISVTGLSIGFHNLFIRVKDSLNIWSLYEGRVIYIQPIITQVDPAPLVAAEYFFNSPDPGVGNGFQLASFTKADSINILRQINTSGLPNGFNNLFIRVKDSLNVWSLYEGRKFFICPNVLATPIITANNSICQDATISGSGSTVANATSYLWTGPNGFTQSGQTLSRLNANPSMNGVYTFFAIRSGGTKCDSSFASVTINVNPIYNEYNPQTICENDSYAINGNSYTISGNYIDTLVSLNGCDSIVNTQLTVIPTIHADNYQNLCGSATYSFNGNIYSTNGTYIDTVQTVNGCDSIVTTYLTINPIYNVNNPQSICANGSYSIGTNTYTVAGNYIDVLQSVLGCDSTVNTQLTVVTAFASTNPQTICQGGSYSINGNTYTEGNTYTDVMQSVNGCDSIVTTILTVIPSYSVSNPQTICQGESYAINGSTYTLANTYVDVMQSVNGCDSIVTTILTVNPTFAVTNPQSICPGGSYSINGNTYTAANTYTDVIQSVNGCDSIVTTILTVNPIYAVNNPQSICTNGSYTINGNTYTVAGNYVDNLQTISGCDSIVTTQLTVVTSFATTNPQTICQGDSYSINGNTYTLANTYTDLMQSVTGCDSLVTTILTVNPTFATTNPQTICEGESYTINGNTYTVAGSYPTTFQTINGCDSIVTTILTVNPSYNISNPQTICQGGSYTINGNTYTVAGTYSDLYQSVSGCDSLVNTILTVTNATLNSNVSISGTTLSSLENNATYQWLDCGNNNLQIGSATNQSFTALGNGSYAVQLTSLTCNVVATSLCFTIDNVGLDDANIAYNLAIYPNPTSEFFTIENKEFSLGNIKIFDASGKLIFDKIENQKSLQIDSKNWSDGVYMIEIYSEKGIFHQKIIKE